MFVWGGGFFCASWSFAFVWLLLDQLVMRAMGVK